MIGKVISGLGTVCYCVFGVWGFILSLAIVNQAVGFWGFVAAFVLFPVTFVAAPWYALFHWGTWFPLEVSYGGFIAASILMSVGGFLNAD